MPHLSFPIKWHVSNYKPTANLKLLLQEQSHIRLNSYTKFNNNKFKDKKKDM